MKYYYTLLRHYNHINDDNINDTDKNIPSAKSSISTNCSSINGSIADVDADDEVIDGNNTSLSM